MKQNCPSKFLECFKLCFITYLYISNIYSQPVSIKSVFKDETIKNPDSMELTLINEEERGIKDSPTAVSMSSNALTSLEEKPTIKPLPSETITTNSFQGVNVQTLQFNNLPKIESDVVLNFEGNLEVKNTFKKQNEELCSKKISEIKQVIEEQLKRSVYKVECTEPEFQRIDGSKMQYVSKATVTFY